MTDTKKFTSHTVMDVKSIYRKQNRLLNQAASVFNSGAKLGILTWE